ncbi:MAG: hypothetical protein L0Y71_19600 [Gemmataceae bacterium]|nr:hypothetical protein [Gemmataceae bacterium]
MQYDGHDSHAHDGCEIAPQQINCTKHGPHDFAIVCMHICRAIRGGSSVGFFWSTDTDGPRPDAWCRSCELWNRQHPGAPLKEWMQVANFQLLCVHCWDEAKTILYDRFHETAEPPAD